MALVGILTHLKTRQLAKLLKIDRCFCVGILETLWHLTAEQAPAGDIGRLTDGEIAIELAYTGDPTKLISALVASGFLDHVNGECRLLVHDWEKHCPQYVKRKLQRYGKQFEALTSHELVIDELMADTSAGTGTGTGISIKASNKRKTIPRGNGSFERFWVVWPKKVEKISVEKWFKTHPNAPIDEIVRAVEEQKNQWQDPKYIPHPTKWLNRGQWEDQITRKLSPTEEAIQKLREARK